MKPFSILLVILLSLTSAISQDSPNCDCYDRLTNLSTYYEKQGDLEQAIAMLENGMNFKEKVKWTPYEYFKLSELYAANGALEKSSQYLEVALKMGFDIEYVDSEGFDELKKSPYWPKMIDRLDALKREFQGTVNWEYRLAVEDIRGSDQTIRRLIKVPDSLFQTLDSINYVRIKKLIDKFGYPDMKTHGFDGTQSVYLQLLHASMYSEEQYQEILQILENAIETYSFKKSNLAQFIDRRAVWYHKKKQTFGTWNAYRAKEFKEFRAMEGVDSKRFQYNLLRLKEQAVIEKRALPTDYKAEQYPTNYFCGYPIKE